MGMLNVRVKTTLHQVLDAAMQLTEATQIETEIQSVLDSSSLQPSDRIFIRGGAVPPRTAIGLDVPTAKLTARHRDA
jgi:hypothetical protein